MKTTELTGAPLDWAVWKCAGGADAYPKTASGEAFLKLWQGNRAKYLHPSTDWAQGGPIIERERICTVHYVSDEDGQPCEPGWFACIQFDGEKVLGATLLVAAMRCYVASKLGEEVEVPEGLL